MTSQNSEKNWHNLTDKEVIQFFKTNINNGLSISQQHELKRDYGENRITQKKGKSPLILFLLQFHQPLVYILLASALVTSILKEWVDAGVIFGVVLVNAIIGYVQESKAVKAIEALSQALTTSATVIRDGQKQQISATELVPGDIVMLVSGDKVPADLRLLFTRELQIDESALTGESVPVQKRCDELPWETVLADRLNMAYSSTLVTYGIATGVVVATGNDTEIGRINKLIANADILATPLTIKISRFSTILLYVILFLAAVTFVVGVLRGETWLNMFMAVVALAVGAIPEGLPAAVTITLAIGVGKMAKRNTIIRKLPAVETLGSTTIICSDKTGTLTQNQMTVQQIYAGECLFKVTGSGYTPVGEITPPPEKAENTTPLSECLNAGLFCNDTRVVQRDGEWQVEGDPTEAALIVSASKAGIHQEKLSQIFPRLDTLPFESQHQYMATLHDTGEKQTIYLKGSVESVLQRCSHSLSSSGELITVNCDKYQQVAEQMASEGLRVLAFASVERQPTDGINHDHVAAGLTFLGLQGMIDPPRQEAIAAVHACQRAGISVKMITGDHVITATAIARTIGLITETAEVGQSVALNGRKLEQLDDHALSEAAQQCAVFARVAPEQKLRLVKALQGRGHIVAMTGDGVNDAPALRQADIGVAMGITGTQVSREAADMILTDDNFSSIEAAIEEGRGVYDNLVKFITWTLPTNLGEGLVILAAVFAGAELPILPVQILWINMTTAVLLGLMLAFEPKEPGIMDRKPLDPKKPLLTSELVTKIILVGILLLFASFGLFKWELSHGASVAVARTCAVNIFVFGELFYLFNCRSMHYSPFKLGFFSNLWVIGGSCIMIMLQILFTYLPAMNIAFASEPIAVDQWGLIIATSFLIYLIIEAEKWLRYGSKEIKK